MGSGKSTAGRILAARTGYAFVDSDNEVEARAGVSVVEIFRQSGESHFRELERLAICDLLTADHRVIATGGGAFIDEASGEELLARAFTVHLSCDFQEAFRRVEGLEGRPLVRNGEVAAMALYQNRKAKYARAHASVDTTHRTPDEVAAAILILLG